MRVPAASSDGLLLRDFTLRLQDKALFAPLSFAVEPGSLVAVTGPSGCGKSSLLLALCGLLQGPFAVEGTAWMGGQPILDLPAERRRLGLIFQDPLLLPHLSVGRNLAFGLRRVSGAKQRDRARLVAEALEQIHLAGYEDRDPTTLSGGQRARVALMRSLLAEPRALLLDEPFASLDPPLRRDMRSLLSELLVARALPALLVTHDRSDAEALACREIVLKKGEVWCD
ncbi:MAG: ATP-binding cassette domain-containing protein [Rhodospirillales bacterium]